MQRHPYNHISPVALKDPKTMLIHVCSYSSQSVLRLWPFIGSHLSGLKWHVSGCQSSSGSSPKYHPSSINGRSTLFQYSALSGLFKSRSPILASNSFFISSSGMRRYNVQSLRVMHARKFSSLGSASRTPFRSSKYWLFLNLSSSSLLWIHSASRRMVFSLELGDKSSLAARNMSRGALEMRSRGQNFGCRLVSPFRACSALIRAMRAHWRQRLEFLGAEGDCTSHLGLNS